MKLVKKILVIFLSVVLAALLYFLVDGYLYMKERAEYLDSYRDYAPRNCPNTLWTCNEKNLYFISDKEGYCMGSGEVDGETIYFRIIFDFNARIFDATKCSDMTVNAESDKYYSVTGCAEYNEDGCVLSYESEKDGDTFWGKEEGTVTLTFTRQDLEEPFSFEDAEGA